MDTYIRFQTPLRCGHGRRFAGPFIVAGRVEDSPLLAESTRERICESLNWFNENLTVPSLEDRDWRCIFWFRSDAKEMIQRMWELVAILSDEGINVRKLWTKKPGKIVYSDRFQIGAIPTRDSTALRV